jgi:hypothetical protein
VKQCNNDGARWRNSSEAGDEEEDAESARDGKEAGER